MYFWTFFFFFFNLPFKITVTGRAGVGRRPRFTFWLTFFSKLYVTIFLQWLAFMFGRGGGSVGVSHTRETNIFVDFLKTSP